MEGSRYQPQLLVEVSMNHDSEADKVHIILKLQCRKAAFRHKSSFQAQNNEGIIKIKAIRQ